MARDKKLTKGDHDLLNELGIDVESKTNISHTPREERIITGFEEIQMFVDQHNRLPEYGEDRDIFERLYAVRLDQIRQSEECRNLVKDLDYQKLLIEEFELSTDMPDEIDDDDLLAQLGVNETKENSITNLRHVKSRAEKKAAEEIANRTPCENFDQFKTLFEQLKKDINTGYRITVQFKKDAGFTKSNFKEKQFIIVGGQIAFIAEIGDAFKAPNGEDDARMRVIYDNGTESNILLRSLIRAMYNDETSRFIADLNSGPLFSGENSEDDQASGTIYVLRSFSDHVIVSKNRNIVHKIGVTGGDIKKRISSAKTDPTFLMADVEVIATYKLANVSRTKLEKIIHKFFGTAKLDIEIKDRFGKLVKANEWFLVPLFIIDEMVDKIKDGTVSEYFYDPISAQLKKY